MSTPAETASSANPTPPAKERVAVVTGGGTGIGLAIARALVEDGSRVVLLGRRPEVLEEAAAELGSAAVALPFDVCDTAAAEGLVQRVRDAAGEPTALINNAGIHLKKPAFETTGPEMTRVLDTHVVGAFALSSAFGKAMAERGGGSILFVASMASLFGIPQVVAYTAAKTAQVGLVRALASEWSGQNVRVNAIAPGWIETSMSKKAFEGDPERLKKVLGRTPMGRLGQPAEIGRVARFLCSDDASFITGAVLPVDGGASIGF